MNTLSPQQLSALFPARADYLAFRSHWRCVVNSPRKHELRAAHFLLYLAVTGKDWRKAFSFPTQINKLNNGYTPALYDALDLLASNYRASFLLQAFDGLVTEEMLGQVRKLLSGALRHRPQAGTDGHPDCEAYIIEALASQEG